MQDNTPSLGQANQQLLDQKPVIDYDRPRLRGHPNLLIGQIRVIDRRDPASVSMVQHPTKLPPGRINPARHY